MKKAILLLGILVVCASVASAGNVWYTLWAGQTENAGEFKVYSVSGSLVKVDIWPENGWKIVESHVEIVPLSGEFPSNKGGNVKVGQFRWAMKTAPTLDHHIYSILFNDIAPGLLPGDEVKIAIHAVMVKTDMYGCIIQEETAWGGPCSNYWSPGEPLLPGFYKLGSNAWGYYFLFTL